MRRSLATFAAMAAVTGLCSAQVSISEMLINPPGPDDGQESIEIRGPANTKLTGYSFFLIEGDKVQAGIVDLVIDLSGYSTGSNGLLLIRDTTAVLKPAPAVGTSVVVLNPTPDIENGSYTFVLGRGTAPTFNTDLDADNDGKLDNGLPNFTVVDAFAWTDGDGGNYLYAAQIGGFEMPHATVFTPDFAYRTYDAAGNPFCWTVGDVTAPSSTGPYAFDFANLKVQGGLAKGYGPQGLDLGGANGSLSFCADAYNISLAKGGTQNLDLDAGSGNAGNLYLMLGSLTGTLPGIKLTSTVTLPLTLDPYLLLLVGAPNTVIAPSIGLLDSKGRASATLTLPANAPLALAAVLYHAALVIDTKSSVITFASTPTTLYLR